MTNPPQSPVDWGDAPGPQPVGGPRPARQSSGAHRPTGLWRLLRIVVLVFGLVSLVFWGYISWPYPLPALYFMIGAPAFAAAVWFFFRSPRSPLDTDPVGKVIVEVALVVTAAASWLSIGAPLVGLVFLVVAAVSGIVTFRQETAA